jgi:hypothetical protein
MVQCTNGGRREALKRREIAEGLAKAVYAPKSYLIAWVALKDQNGNFTTKIETVFDCKGRSGVVQQLITNDSKESRYHSYDATASFESYGARTSFYEKAESLVCKGKR